MSHMEVVHVKLRLLLVLGALAIGLVAAPLSATPPPVPLVANWAITPNLTALSFSERSVPTSGPESNFINSDLAFWGDMVVQGHYNGFRLVDVDVPVAAEGDHRLRGVRAEEPDRRRSRQPGRHRHLREHPQPLVELEHGAARRVL